ncbi:O-methyltransferase [Quadrisphaera sp. DSM 44207]|uniref:O-methyltransferase n=1 Tax=Quadrisphaera sp. DSM 44207 TaxID=1881057 RepID=UPI000884164B|nr:O-methyltransferase [Quadrisphaera sp. DSM 44207]SDQ34480.1 Predicted O-methyltransferase YrrM [Quadrisphaera sp. DSM 44207]
MSEQPPSEQPSEQQQVAVDDLLTDLVVGADPVLERALAASRAAGLPAIDVAPNQGKLLMLLARLAGARRVLEVGTLGGYSTTWLVRGLPVDGRVLTLELEPRHAEAARANLERAGVADRVEVRVGPAVGSLEQLVAEGAEPFDLVFLDADKQGTPRYLELALQLTRPGSVIVCDNVVRGGRIVEPGGDEAAAAMRTALAWLGAHPLLEATALQTVGAKGWDGFALAVVTAAPS